MTRSRRRPDHGRSLLVGILGTATTTVLLVGAAGCGGGEATPTTTTAVTLTTDADADPAQVGAALLSAAGAAEAVSGDGATARLAELATTWCTTALRSDVENADATFRFSLNEFFTDFGVVTAEGELQDVPLAKAMLAGTYAEPLARAANEQLCPEVQRPAE